VVTDRGLRYRYGDDPPTPVAVALSHVVGLRPRHSTEAARWAVHADWAMRGGLGLPRGRVLALTWCGPRRRSRCRFV